MITQLINPAPLFNYVEELINTCSIYRSSVNKNTALILSINGVDTECYVINKEGEIVAYEYITSKEMYLVPTAYEYLNWYECHRNKSYFKCKEEGLLITH